MDCNFSELISFLSKSKLHELDLGDCGTVSIVFTLCARVSLLWRMAATLHAKINRRKLDKLNIIKIWLLFASIIFVIFSSTFNVRLFTRLILPIILQSFVTVKRFWTHQFLWLSGSPGFSWVIVHSPSLWFFFNFSPCFRALTTRQHPLLYAVFRWGCDCLRAKSQAPLRYSSLNSYCTSISNLNSWITIISNAFSLFMYSVLLHRWCFPFSGTHMDIQVSFAPPSFNCLIIFSLKLWNSQVEINEAWKVKAAPDPTVLPKGKSHAKSVIVFLFFFSFFSLFSLFDEASQAYVHWDSASKLRAE